MTAKKTQPGEQTQDIAGGCDALPDLVAAENPNAGNPRWARFVELGEREKVLRQMAESYKLRQGADNVVPDHEARRIVELGQLIVGEQRLLEQVSLAAVDEAVPADAELL